MRRMALLLALLAIPGALLAHGGDARHDSGEHGTASGSPFMVEFFDQGIHLTPRDAVGDGISASGLSGEVKLRRRKAKDEVAALEVVQDDAGRVRHLMLMRDFSGVRDGSLKADFVVRGLAQGEARFSQVLRRRYPLSWCPVSGEDLEGDASPVEVMHQGRLVRFCCPACVPTFQADPAKYLAVLDAAARGDKVKRPAGSGSARMR